MATRSYIAVQDGEELLVSYVHFDGYPKVRMPILKKYNTIEAATALVNLGDMSVIAETLDECDTYFKQGEEWENVKPFHVSLDDFLTKSGDHCIEFLYLFNEDKNAWEWYRA